MLGLMTAEIAIINRGAVTLAADSAVTLSIGGTEKVYTSADKLFELSETDPIAVMIFNNLTFMGLPLDVLIKKFRDEKAKAAFKTVAEAADAFFHYLEKEIASTPEGEKQQISSLVLPILSRLAHDFAQAAQKASIGLKQGPKKNKYPDFSAIFTKVLNGRIADLKKRPVSACFENLDLADIGTKYSETFEQALTTIFDGFPLLDDFRPSLMDLCLNVLVRDRYSDMLTGFVFAGFGKDEMMPSLHAYEADGIIAGRLKKKKTESVSITRDVIDARIIPFAQREMVDRFLYGVDPGFEAGIENYIAAVVSESGEGLLKQMPKMAKARRDKLKQSLADSVEKALKVWREKAVPEVKEHFREQVQEMVLLMPKLELANLAQELVNLTSVKRKFSNQQETVGGPIDVAVISRNDGFVWVQRKHYFKPELNPRYFVRKFGRPQ